MTVKARDVHDRWRSKTVAFRMSEQEKSDLDRMVALSGLTKQDYIISKLLNKDVIVRGNPRVFKALKNTLSEIYAELKKLASGEDPSPELLETIRIVSVILGDMTKESDI